MSPLAIALLAITMSVDSFAVSVGRGAAIGRPRVSEALRTGIVFGVVEALAPVIGWIAGVAASQFVEAIDHWIAFALLAGVGVHMLYTAIRTSDADAPRGSSLTALIATAIGTSLDAMAVGVSLALLQVDIVVIAIAIGVSTFVMSSGGMLLGFAIGERFGKAAELIAGVVLCGLGVMILAEHLTGA
ncbi:manganese efflux pump MntP family protein [Blastochloris viridis]|uniref:Putative manganese efflux pump MntP n=1 Tax=Blastochloris viridis TaxID=1079 RepID=A0A0H5BIF9_BLAVI|nr:manganese efflux pump MntP family protein [Blastochloris viridis]ALK09869.1 putative manganese efflux pump MntP [Blastochloris viridis]BAS00227.1 integral membrane protein [Blastochloris viridis]CUU42532.1 hypothetical protein BVIRIDIS_15450 [Blastochloris viridis]